jgi:hypothetical protein
MVSRLEVLRHVDMNRVAVSLCQTRRRSAFGLQASLTPLKFEAGTDVCVIEGQRYGAGRLTDENGREFLYILSFYLPRYQNLSWEEKLSTVLHELWHISPRFDGDLRRHAGRCSAHGPSQDQYDAQMDELAQRWLALDPPEHAYEFLALDFAALAAVHGKVVGTHWPTPKLLPL